ERYSHLDELRQFAPYTSKDIDYFGRAAAAERIAALLGGKIEFPNPGHHTPSTAVVTAYVGSREIKIDFVSHIMGVNDNQLEKNSVVARFHSDLGAGEIEVPIMHPLHCFQS